MSVLSKAAVAAVVVLGIGPSLAVARTRHHHAIRTVRHTHVVRHHYVARGVPGFRAYAGHYGYQPYGRYSGPNPYGAYGPSSAEFYPPTAADDPYSPYAAPGAIIRRQALINQNAPGVTNELAPDNIATATGGPVGGVPGFSAF